MQRWGVAWAVAVVGAALWSAPVAAVQAGPITAACGDTVTTDVTLDADLTCTGTALTVGASNITIDLGGHVITGTDGSLGISGEKFDGITVRNGLIQGFAFGVNLVEGGSITVEDLQIEVAATSPGGFPTTAVNLADVTGGQVSGNRISGGQIGVALANASGTTIADNQFDAVQTGIEVITSSDLQVSDNTTRNSGGGITFQGISSSVVRGNTATDGLTGFYVFNPDTTYAGTVLEDNVATGNSSAGIFVDEGAGSVELRGNQTDRNDIGISVKSPATTIAGNTANDNTALGIDAITGVTDGGGNLASGNGDPRQCVGVVCTAPPGFGEPGPPPAPEPGPGVPPPNPPAPEAPRSPQVAVPVPASPRFTG